MFSIENIFAFFLAYLIGSIPTSVWIGKGFYGIDVREFGSGNAGATNTFRVLGKKAGIPVLLLDIFKGYLAVYLACFFIDDHASQIQFVNLQLAMGIAALLGHIFPIYAGFRGGKGIATLLGLMIGIHTEGALAALLIFLIVFLVTRYVSLGSMVAAVSFPLLVIIVFKSRIPSLIIFSIFIAILVLLTHQKNIERLLRREESRAKLKLNIKRSVAVEEDDDEEDDD